jgi:hypothetical protein
MPSSTADPLENGVPQARGRPRMRKRLRWLVCLAVVLVLVGVLVHLLFPSASPVTRVAFDRIQTGMTQAEVEAILGGPPGDYRTRPMDPIYENHRSTDPEIEPLQWWGDEGEVLLTVESRGVVLSKDFYAVPEWSIGRFEMLKWRLLRCWERIFGTAPSYRGA